MSKQFGESERRIKNLFAKGTNFTWNGKTFEVEVSGKPVCSSGEPKTDIYILAFNRNTNEKLELKISFKQENAEFLENKTTAERAENLFGEHWQDIICDSINTMINQFETKPLIFKEGKGRTEKGSITLGWKFELLNVQSGNLSGRINLTPRQLIDVYAGTTLSQDKRNAIVDEMRITDSGVANYILFDSVYIDTIDDVLENIVSINKYVDENPYIYFACKALNYRSFKCKYDGNRPLAVYVDWSIVNGKLHPTIVYDNPLKIRGDYVANKLISSMRALNIKTTDDITRNILTDSSKIYG